MKYCIKKVTGFSSWGSGQLENEIKNGDWLPQEKQENIIKIAITTFSYHIDKSQEE